MSGATLVVGANGLLGSAVYRVLNTQPIRTRQSTTMAATIRWGTPHAAADICASVEHLAQAAERSSDEPWRVLWCAGAGVNGTSQEQFDREIDSFSTFVTALTERLRTIPGGLFLASSAGGVYAGAQHPPFTEGHEPRPLSAYGETKLAMEHMARRAFDGTEHALAIGRIANLYGPGQNLGKMQGLISHICKGIITDSPVGIYVPVDTVRDYIYVDDAARLVISLLDTALATPGEPVVKIVCSGEPVTISELVGMTRTLVKRHVPVIYATSGLAKYQSSDLRLRSIVLPELGAQAVTTPLPVGVAATYHAIHAAAMRGELSR